MRANSEDLQYTPKAIIGIHKACGGKTLFAFMAMKNISGSLDYVNVCDHCGKRLHAEDLKNVQHVQRDKVKRVKSILPPPPYLTRQMTPYSRCEA